MVVRRVPQRMTVDEWCKLERTSHDIKHEYIDGRAYAISGGSLAHGRIGLNACLALESALLANNKPCFVYNSDVATRLSPTHYTYPDASVSCDEQDQPAPEKTEVQASCVIVEVLSDSTEAYDRGRKLGFYCACPTIHEYDEPSKNSLRKARMRREEETGESMLPVRTRFGITCTPVTCRQVGFTEKV